MNEPIITMLFQQLLEQVEQISSLTAVAQLGLAECESMPQLAQPICVENQQHWRTLQRQLSNKQQDLTNGLQRLQQRITQIELLQGISEHLDAQVDIADLLEASLDAIWQKVPLRFAVIVLGEAELGPYTYQRMRGVPDAWRFMGKACPFPLWGVLARALLPRLDPDEADYLVIQDICTVKRPRPEEFPWMALDGSLMILPLRTQNRVIGAILLGREIPNGFVDQELRHDFYIIAHTTARILQIAQVRHELDERSNQLLSLQLFTKSIASIRIVSQKSFVRGALWDSSVQGPEAGTLGVPDKTFLDSYNVEKLIDSMIDGISETFGRVAILVYLNDRVWSKEVATYGELDAHVRSIIDWTMQAGQPIFYDPDDNTESLERFYYNESGRALVTPIIRNERTLGAIQIVAQETARPFAEGDMIVLRTIANAVAIML